MSGLVLRGGVLSPVRVRHISQACGNYSVFALAKIYLFFYKPYIFYLCTILSYYYNKRDEKLFYFLCFFSFRISYSIVVEREQGKKPARKSRHDSECLRELEIRMWVEGEFLPQEIG